MFKPQYHSKITTKTQKSYFSVFSNTRIDPVVSEACIKPSVKWSPGFKRAVKVEFTAHRPAQFYFLYSVKRWLFKSKWKWYEHYMSLKTKMLLPKFSNWTHISKPKFRKQQKSVSLLSWNSIHESTQMFIFEDVQLWEYEW